MPTEKFDPTAYKLSYQSQNLLRIPLNLNRQTEPDLIDWLSKQPNRQGYIKALIRSDMQKAGK